MRSLSFRVVASLATIVLGGFHAGRAQAQATTSLQVLTPQGPVEIDSKWSAEDDSRQRARFAMQSRTRLRAPLAPSELTGVDSGEEGVSLSWPDVASETSYILERAPAFPSPVSIQANTTAYNDPSGAGLYHYRIKAANLAGSSEVSEWIPVLVKVSLPAAPSGLVAYSPGNGTAQLSWTDNSHNEVRFEIQRSPSFSVGVSVGSNITNFVDMPGPGTAYYRVRAVNAAGASNYTPWIQAGVTAPVPATPTNLAAVDLGNGSARVTWSDNSNNETSFQVERQPSSGGPVNISANATSFDDPCGSGSFSYRIRAVNSAGASSYTPWAAVNVASSSAPTPTNVHATDVGNRRAMVSWTDNAITETGFEVQRSPAFTAGTVQVGANVTAYVDPCGAGTFAYRVRSRSAAGASAYSGWASVNIANTPPAAPSAVTLEDMGNQTNVRIGWTDNADNETGFMIQRQVQVSGVWGGTVNKTTGANATTYMDNPGTGKFRYRMCATNSAGSSTWTVWLVVDVGTGWTVFTPSGDSRIVYVSSSGNDSNTGLSEAAPKRTIAAGYALLRHGYPDWLLLKRGDTWTESLPNWRKSGRNESERMVVGSYGSVTVRPELRTGSVNGVTITGGSGSPPTIDHLAFVGLHFSGYGRVASSEGIGIFVFKSGSDFLIEDCKIEGYSVNLNLIGDGAPFDRVRLRRCVVVDSFREGAHSQGLYADNLTNLLIEECVFDNNGWKGGAAAPTMFNHNVYIQSNSGPATLRGNIISRGASHGAQVRAGGVVFNNLFAQNSLASFVSKNLSSMTHNVVLHGKDIDPSNPRGCGFEVLPDTPAGSEVSSNLFAHLDDVGPNAYALRVAAGGITIADNVVYNWASPTDGAIQFNASSVSTYSGMQFSGNKTVLPAIPAPTIDFDAGPWVGGVVQFGSNKYFASSAPSEWFMIGGGSLSLSAWTSLTGDSGASYPPSSFPDPSRSLARYNAEQGGEATLADFLARVRTQSRWSWNPAYTAGTVNAWIRAGFQIAEP